MQRDQLIGTLLVVVSIIAVAVYLWLLFIPPIAGVDTILIKITAAVAIVAIFGILGWIGYTLATTPPPKPIEEIEKEIEEELKKLEKETAALQQQPKQ
ncbi:MAG: transcriptional regulator [Ignisphaera sp.]